MEKFLKKTAHWARNNSGRLLLYAVLLTGCFSVKFAAYGKYVDFVKDYTSAVAAPFYFSSNYLGDSTDVKNYVIGTFNGSDYELDIEVRNNDNAFNFDQNPQDFYYYVTAEMFLDAAHTRPYPSSNYKTIIKYGKSNEYAAGMAKMVKCYEYATASELKPEEEWEDPEQPEWEYKSKLRTAKDIIIDSNTIQNYGQGYLHQEEYNGWRLVGYLPGLTPENETEWADVTLNGKQTVNIKISWTGALPTDSEDKAIYLKVTAHTIPACEINTSKKTAICNINKAVFGEYSETFFPADYKNYYTGDATFPDLSSEDPGSVFDADYASETGIYDMELVGNFKLTSSADSEIARIRRSFNYSRSDYAVMYTFFSNINTAAKIYYDGTKMKPDASLGTPVPDSSQEKDDHSGNHYTHYVLTNLYANGSKSCYFYKNTLDTNISEYDALAVETTTE